MNRGFQRAGFELYPARAAPEPDEKDDKGSEVAAFGRDTRGMAAKRSRHMNPVTRGADQRHSDHSLTIDER